MKKPWFRAKKYGWGWGLPLTWQGWVVYVVYFLFITYLFRKIENHYNFFFNTPLTIFIPFFIATIILLIIAYKTGEKPEWRWGGKKSMVKINEKNDYTQSHNEPHLGDTGSKLNWLRASVLGANDGIVSIAGLVVGVAGATNSIHIIFTAGFAGIIAGAISMAAGEYVSVSSSRDTESSLLKKEEYELEHFPKEEFEELMQIYKSKGLTKQTAFRVATELTQNDAYAAHIEAELGIDPNNLTNPWHAAFASSLSFFGGAIIPLIAITVAPTTVRIPFTFIAVIIALMITGTVSAKIGNAPVIRAIIRVVCGGALAMLVTYAIGRFFGVNSL